MSIQTHHPANTISTHGQSGASCVPPLSSSSFSYGFIYDVFLSFRGPDTRYGFIGNLWKALLDKGIRTFMDKEDLQRGDEILPSVFKAIEKSRIFIPVFSANYASSSFCLDELARIFDCIRRKGRLVLPVFYDVDPSHVRYQTGSYGKALASHEEKFRNFKVNFDDNMERLQKWKMALKQVANFSGWHFKHGSEYEYELITKMVEEVSDKINRAPFHVADYPIGLERRVLAVKSLLDVGSDDGVHLVGINGIGGMENNTMVRKHTFVSDIGPKNQTSSLLVRIVRLWHGEGVSKSKAMSKQRIRFSLDLILMDSKGDKIGAHIKRELIYKFENSLEEGMVYYITNFNVDANSGQYRSTRHQYMLNFNIRTIVRLDNKGSVPPSVHSFITPSKVFEDGFDTDYLVDVIGILTDVGVEKEYQKNGATSKFKVIQLNNAGYCFECTLFGPYVDVLNSFLAAGESENAVVAILSAKVKTYLGKPSLQNTFGSTKLLFNLDIAEATELRKSTLENFGVGNRLPTASKVDISEDLLSLTPKATIASLKESTEESSYSVMGTITEIIDPEDWWYNACICNKSVYPDSDMFFCKKCNKHVSTVTKRYRIKLRVTHGAVSTIFVLFDNNAKSIFHKSCADMIAAIGQGSDSNTLPKEISDLKDKTFIFKVSSKIDTPEGYEKSYRVQKLCNDPEIMLKFNEANLHKDVVGYGFASNPSNVSPPNAMSDVPLAQDLMQKFTASDVWAASHSKTNEVIDLCNDSRHLTPLKRAAPDDGSNVDANEPVKLLKNDIKIEND